MALYINDGWDVAHHHMHEAFTHLGEACAYNKNACAKYMHFEKKFHWADLLGTSADVRVHFVAENKLSIKATLLFQAGMEAWISWAYTKSKLSTIKKPGGFKCKWEVAFDHLGSQYDFGDYGNFYTHVRNPIVHPSNESDVEKVANVWCKPVYDGLKSGWSAMSALGAIVGFKPDDNSWEKMCDLNNVPKVMGEDDVLDLQSMERTMKNKHVQGAREALNEEE